MDNQQVKIKGVPAVQRPPLTRTNSLTGLNTLSTNLKELQGQIQTQHSIIEQQQAMLVELTQRNSELAETLEAVITN